LESELLTIEVHNVSVNLSQEYQKEAEIAVVGMLAQTLFINNSLDATEGNATLMFITFMSEGNESNQIAPEAFAEYMGNMMIGAFKLSGAKEVGNMVVKNSIGENVTIETIRMPQEDSQSAPKDMHLAYWSFDPYNNVLLTSNLDLNTTAEIVETLTIKP